MSMPGFVFHFRCNSCNAASDDYSLYPFPDILRPSIILPAWSLTHRCWAAVSADLSLDDRRAMESDRDVLLAFAASLSSDSMTVGVPQMTSGESDMPDVRVTPDPQCPFCGVPCQTPFGYPPDRNKPQVAPQTTAEFRAAPITCLELSVRARMICRDLGIQTLGQLEDAQSQFAAHSRATQNTLREIDDYLCLKPEDDS